MTTKNQASSPRIWAIGGGKGGVGKSVIAANLAIETARRGTTVTLVDMDLGGANAHTLLGLGAPTLKITDFVERRIATLAETITPTPVGGLGLIAGAGATPGAANTRHAQKERLLRNLRTLPSNVVLLDLGAGTAFNVLDFFVGADLGIVVTMPEHTSVENANNFLRAAFFRRLVRSTATRPFRSVIRELIAQPQNAQPLTPRQLVDAAAGIDEEAPKRLRRALEGFGPAIVVNQVRVPGDRALPEQMAGAAREYFGIAAWAGGFIPADRLVGRSVRERRPVVEAFPGAPFSAAVGQLADALLASGASDA
ncbi:MAG: MinD/ParA family protein [Acidobacteria bacterium]|nr:MinD/ParA family protein [Acidobacteriota bacterium]